MYRPTLSAAAMLALAHSSALLALDFGPYPDIGIETTSQVPALVSREDIDGDGLVTRGEVSTLRLARFSAADLNGDGTLSLNELAQMEAQQREEHLAIRFNLIDYNADGGLTADEFLSASPRGAEQTIYALFGAIAGFDGVMSFGEFVTLHSPEGKVVKRFVSMDLNGDGTLSSDEFGGPPPHHRAPPGHHGRGGMGGPAGHHSAPQGVGGAQGGGFNNTQPGYSYPSPGGNVGLPPGTVGGQQGYGDDLPGYGDHDQGFDNDQGFNDDLPGYNDNDHDQGFDDDHGFNDNLPGSATHPQTGNPALPGAGTTPPGDSTGLQASQGGVAFEPF